MQQSKVSVKYSEENFVSGESFISTYSIFGGEGGGGGGTERGVGVGTGACTYLSLSGRGRGLGAYSRLGAY